GGVAQRVHDLPASSVRRTVPLLPLAQAIPLPTLSMPRRSAAVEVGLTICHWADAGSAASKNANESTRSMGNDTGSRFMVFGSRKKRLTPMTPMEPISLN